MMQMTSSQIVARSQSFRDIMALACKVSNSPCTVLITGESGTGKELIARTIHDASDARKGKYIPLNVAAMPSELVESQLFGHVRGAFTGATENRNGAFRAATDGTLLLDEVGDLPMETQPKLLRALEQKEIIPVGADEPVSVDARIVAATSRDLDRLAHDGEFRSDLLFRLNVVQIEVPPLRNRPEDIPVLVDYYCLHFCAKLGKPVPQIAPATMQQLVFYPWPGNVRELAHVIERALLFCDGSEITLDDLNINQDCPQCDELRLDKAVDAFKRRHIVGVLERVHGSRTEAARALGLSPATLFRYIDRFDLKGYGCKADHSHRREHENLSDSHH